MVVLAAGAVIAVRTVDSGGTYPLRAVFSRAPGLFSGASVEVLGVPVGTVTSVTNVGDDVVVGMAVDNDRGVPAGATAALISPELLGEPDVELDPGYTSGPRLEPGSEIPVQRTTVPVSTDQLLRSLARFLHQLNPHAVGNLVGNLAQDLNGQGAGLNKLIAGAAGTLQLLAEKGDDLGQLNGTLAQLTGVLDTRTSQIDQLLTDYDTVSATLAQHGQQLGDALTQLTGASTQLVSLLTPNLAPLEADVGTVTTAGRTLDRNLSSVDEIFSSATLLFTAAQRAYDPTYNWLNLNAQVAPGVTGAVLAGLVRDRLAGVCRRIAAHHASGLSASQLAALNQCGNPSSGYFDPVIDKFTQILGQLSSGNASDALLQGLAKIPGIGPAVSSAAAPSPSSPTSTPSTAPAASSGSAGKSSGSSSGSSSPSSGSSSGSSGSSSSSGTSGSGCVPLLGSLLGCSSGTSSGSSSSSGSGSSSSNSSSLLAYRTPAVNPAPSLVAPAARLLSPSTVRHSHPHHHGTGWWGHVGHLISDTWSWI